MGPRRMKKHPRPAMILALAALAAAPAPDARAESCTLRGEPLLPNGTVLYEGPAGGAELAHFSGAEVALAVTDFPEAAGGGRAAVETSGFKLKGFVRARDLPVYTARAVPVYAGHSWIGEGRKVTVLGRSGARLQVEKVVSWPLSGTFQGWSACDAFTLSPRVPPGWSAPGGYRGYVVKKDRIDLYTAEKGDVVTSIERVIDGPGVLLWSNERSGAWIHVEHHGEVVLDAWVRAQDVGPLPPGETMDQLAQSTKLPGSPKLSLQGTPRAAKAPVTIPLRAAASDAALPIGAIEGGTEVLVLDVVAGWANVIPKSLAVMPAGSGAFWARAKELGL